MVTKQDIHKILQRIKYLPNSPMNERNTGEIVDMFFVILKDLSFDLLDKAALFYLGQEKPFFPMPGMIRAKALKLQMLALRIPTPAEAWGIVLHRETRQPGMICETSRTLHEEAGRRIGGEYFQKIQEINQHEEQCQMCKRTTFESTYAHPMVARTVRLLGGLDAILSDNPVADRARFIQAYQEVLEREQSVVGMVPEVREFVQENSERLLEVRRAAFETGERDEINKQYKQLAERLEK